MVMYDQIGGQCMKSIQEMISRKQYFIGRKKELAMMKQQLQKREEWHMLHFYGSAGMGKTVLLKYFAQMHTHLPLLYIHREQGFQSTDEFLAYVHNECVKQQWLKAGPIEGTIAAELNRIANKNVMFILILDGLEHWTSMMDWLKDEFLSKLLLNVKVYSAGRFPLDDWQQDFGWETVVNNIQLQPFRTREMTEYAAAHGISDPRIVNKIGSISQGNPLALAMTCSWLTRLGNDYKRFDTNSRFLTQALNKYWLSEKNLDGVNHQLLALATLPYTFDQELLEHMLGEPIDSAAFAQLCQSTFVESHTNGGWMVKNSIRWLIRTDLKHRFPVLYEQYKQRAHTLLEHRLASSHKDQISLKLELALGTSFLQDSQYIESLIYFGGQQQLTHRAAREDELPMLAEMYQHNIALHPPYLPDDAHKERCFYDIWSLEPSAIQIIEYNGQCVCFYMFVRLTEDVRRVLQRYPHTKQWIEATSLETDSSESSAMKTKTTETDSSESNSMKTKTAETDSLESNSLEENDWFYGVISTFPPFDWEIIGYFLHDIFIPSLYNRRVTAMFSIEDEADFLKLLGFEHLASVDFETPSGLRFYYYRLDAREKQYGEKSLPAGVMNGDDMDEWITLTKQLLSTYVHIQHQLPLLDRCNELWQTDYAYEELAAHIVRLTEQQLQWLKEGDRQEKVQAQILHYAYMRRSGSHETVAALLDIPTSTYYRQLKKLVHTLAYLLRQSNDL